MLAKNVFLAVLLLLSSQCAGEFIIDDFDLDVRLDFPEDHRERSPIVFDHGGWTTQSVFLSSSQTRPNGYLDINGVIPSTAVFDISSLTHIIRDGEYSGPSIEFAYFNTDTGVDLTSGGTADAFVIDVAALTTSYTREGLPFRPGAFTIDVRSEVSGVQHRSGSAPLRYDAGPHSIIVPFDSFVPIRGSGPIDFGHIESLRITYVLTQFDPLLTEDVSVYFELDSIRTGVVPEPSSAFEALVLLASIIVLKRMR